eukprot:CAMPEP_0197560780 /NCGR_PEP_ID=MMETSP1320-20131121/23887_1 /TAXON_ID=91990 /ORGANISM="Bolidomonas sp., Strain RCC2347" /LENGTH=90 /DNA_ID=CAMNT_0043122361 /DNA_START=80 /DNA_END=349 /DNA_ORIENTATION=-
MSLMFPARAGRAIDAHLCLQNAPPPSELSISPKPSPATVLTAALSKRDGLSPPPSPLTASSARRDVMASALADDLPPLHAAAPPTIATTL